MRSRRSSAGALVAVALLVVLGMAACGNDDDESSQPATTRQAQARPVTITAREYVFDVPASITGGVVALEFANRGNEAHFAGIVRVADGRTVDDVRAFFSAPPSGPPPFEEIGGLATADPGASGNQSLVLEPGSYALFCAIPAPDGVPHAAKGMVAGFTVTAPTGTTKLTEATSKVVAKEFSFSALPALEAGDNLITLDNQGTQLHEVNLIELAPGKTFDDAQKWAMKPEGPPPFRSLSGAAIHPGARTTTKLTLKAGSTYAFICAIPDPADGTPHVFKGMATKTFSVS